MQSQGSLHYQQGIDLRHYIAIVWKWLWLIVLGTVVAALTAFVVSSRMKPVYAAKAGVAIVKSRAELTFEPKFVTLSEETALRDAAARRNALAALVANGTIANEVFEALEGQLRPDIKSAGQLLGHIDGELVAGSDYIEIVAEMHDPALAATIANAWATAYERMINATYGINVPNDLGKTIEDKMAESKAASEETQAALVAFLAENRIDELDRRIAEKQGIIANLQQGKETAMTVLIEEQLGAYRRATQAYIGAQASNQLIAFEKAQAGKLALISRYLDARNTARTSVFDEQVQDRIGKLSDLYATRRKLERILADARALQAQVDAGGPGAAASNSLALVLLKAETFASSAKLPGELQLQVGLEGLDVGSEAQSLDLAALSDTLENRLDELDKGIAALSKELVTDPQYDLLGELAGSDDALVQEIKSRYPELFDLDDISNLSEQIAPDNPLARLTLQKSQQLLQLQGLEKIPTYSAEAEDITQAIDKLQSEVRQLQAQVEVENATKRELTRARDLTRETYSTLANKVEEVNIASAITGTEVRFLSLALEPRSKVRPRRLQNTALAGVVGFMLALGVVFLIEYLRSEPELTHPALERV